MAGQGMARTRTQRALRGFTLVEVLVALAVLAIALTAVMRTLAQAIDATATLRDGPWTWQASAMLLDASRRGSSQPGVNGKRPVNVPATSLRASLPRWSLKGNGAANGNAGEYMVQQNALVSASGLNLPALMAA